MNILSFMLCPVSIWHIIKHLRFLHNALIVKQISPVFFLLFAKLVV